MELAVGDVMTALHSCVAAGCSSHRRLVSISGGDEDRRLEEGGSASVNMVMTALAHQTSSSSPSEFSDEIRSTLSAAIANGRLASAIVNRATSANVDSLASASALALIIATPRSTTGPTPVHSPRPTQQTLLQLPTAAPSSTPAAPTPTVMLATTIPVPRALSNSLGIITVRYLPCVERLKRLSRWPCCHIRAQVFAVCTVVVLLVLLCTSYPYLKSYLGAAAVVSTGICVRTNPPTRPQRKGSDVDSCGAPHPSSGRSVLGAETIGCKSKLSSSSSAMEPAEGTPATATTTTAETAAATATATAAATATEEATAAAATAPSSEVRASIEVELASGRSSSGCLWPSSKKRSIRV